ncbi:MAG TPA: hypothetical protein VE623_09340 [Acidimicrobiales bacterium]|jgi:hypothetical protein|nr:hypothetical protein [Acidimicrobiales bacterium]
MRVAFPLVGLGVVVAVGVSACGGSGYQFVANEDLGVYAKLPDGWTIYDEADLFPDDTDQQLERRRASMWVRMFDASDDPTAEDPLLPGKGDPRGVVQAVRLTPEQREQVNLTSLRGLLDPTGDPVAIARQTPAIEVIVDEPSEFDGGYHGAHTVFAVTPEPGADPVLYDRTVLLDSTSTTMFLFQVACEEECFLDTHRDEIAEIVDSWTIQEGDT